MDTVAINARITGRVQGVAFRVWTRSEAKRRGLCGWVRNEPDGAVQAYIIGPALRVDEMVRALKKGPLAARVTNVLWENTEVDPEITDFRITL
ncbi:acylphosphatase [Rhodobacterales bacterium 52_120_T64]|nr:acylphosphatase [Rhodobacterales bacterium 52_120_T64]